MILLFFVGDCAESQLAKLQKLQNHATKIIPNSSCDAPPEYIRSDVLLFLPEELTCSIIFRIFMAETAHSVLIL